MTSRSRSTSIPTCIERSASSCETLRGLELYRVRQGRYRILHGVADAERTVTMVKIGHRRDVDR